MNAFWLQLAEWDPAGTLTRRKTEVQREELSKQQTAQKSEIHAGAGSPRCKVGTDQFAIGLDSTKFKVTFKCKYSFKISPSTHPCQLATLNPLLGRNPRSSLCFLDISLLLIPVFVIVQSLSQSDSLWPQAVAYQASLSFTISWS